MFQMLTAGKANPQQMMSMLSGNPMFAQAQNMINNGGDPKEIVKNIAKQKGIPLDQLQAMANQLGIKL